MIFSKKFNFAKADYKKIKRRIRVMIQRPQPEVDDNMQNCRRSFADVFYLIISDYRRLIQFIILIFSLALIFGGIYKICIQPFLKGKNIVTQLPSGALIYTIGAEEIMTFQIHASSMWECSQWQVKAGMKISIRASGRVNLAIHRLIDNARIDRRPMYPWNGPSGFSNSNDPRSPYLIFPEANWGALIFGITKSRIHSPCLNGTCKCDSIWIACEEGKEAIEFTVPYSGYLWFSINDIPLDSTRQKVYELDPNYDKSISSWNDILKLKYWNVWFDDNTGSFLINVKVLEKSN
jgi:hypothetical protein